MYCIYCQYVPKYEPHIPHIFTQLLNVQVFFIAVLYNNYFNNDSKCHLMQCCHQWTDSLSDGPFRSNSLY